MDFESSTHRTKWIITADELNARMLRANENGVAYVKRTREEHGVTSEGLQCLNAEEERALVSHHTHSLTKKPDLRRLLPRKIIAVAITFVRRFYLDRSVMEFDPMRITPTCLYVACKAGEHYLDAEKVQEIFNKIVKAKEILQLETAVLEGIAFDLLVYEPFRYVDAMLEELRASSEGGDAEVQRCCSAQPEFLKQVYSLAKSFLDSVIRSDAPLLMFPQQQALCAVCHALQKFGMTQAAALERYAAKASKRGQLDRAEIVSSLKATWARGEAFAAAQHEAQDRERVKLVDKKLRTANPLMDTSSKLYKKMKAERSDKKRKRPADNDADEL